MKLNLRKNLTVQVAPYQISYSSTEVHRQIGSVRGHDDLLLGELPQKPCWGKVGNHLRLAMSGGNVDDHPLFLTCGDLFKDSGQFSVVWPHHIARIHMLNEVQKGLAALQLCNLRLILLQK
ncbi:MAG: hypothetical protein ACK559_15110, partial [bacterium]